MRREPWQPQFRWLWGAFAVSTFGTWLESTDHEPAALAAA